MKLQEFCARFGELSDQAFLANFKLPFLLEEGRLALEEGDPSDRSVFQVRTSEEPSKIGRSKSADVRVVHEQISNRHAVIWPPAKGEDQWFLMDMNSTNGTFVDGKKVAAGDRVPLQFGSVLRFGLEARLTFLSPGEMLKVVRKQGTVAPPGEDERKGWDPLSSTTDHKMPAFRGDDTRAGTTAVAADEDETRMVLTCEPFDPVPLEVGRPVIIGRSPKTAHLVLPNSQVSREHCEVLRREDGVVVRDLGSANGTFVCQVRVGEQAMELLPGKPISVGPFKVHLEVPGVSSSDLGATQVVKAGQAAQAPRVEGRLEQVPLEELLNDIEKTQRTGLLTIQAGSLEGRIAFRSGEPLNASLEGTETDDLAAVQRLLGLKVGRFSFSSREDDLGERRISLTLAELLLDRLLQEGG